MSAMGYLSVISYLSSHYITNHSGHISCLAFSGTEVEYQPAPVPVQVTPHSSEMR